MNSVDFLLFLYYTCYVVFALAILTAMLIAVMFTYNIMKWRIEL
jgi:hypothetical protein